jgi:hypothetical protein
MAFLLIISFAIDIIGLVRMMDTLLGLSLGLVDSILDLGAWVGLFGYLYKKVFFKKTFWKVYVYIFLIWNIAYMFGYMPFTRPLQNGSAVTMNQITNVIVTTLILWGVIVTHITIGLFKYAYTKRI